MEYWEVRQLVSDLRDFLFDRGAGGFGSYKDPLPSNGAKRKSLVLKIKEVPNGNGFDVAGSLITPWGEWLIAQAPTMKPWTDLLEEYSGLEFTYAKDGSLWPRWGIFVINRSDTLVHESSVPL